MPNTDRQGLFKKYTLNEVEIAEIADLIALCNQHENLHMRIPLEALAQRSGDEIDDFLYYEQGSLIGYLYIDSWGQKEKEITGMVAPDFRRKGIFRQLFESAHAECKARGVECLVLVAEQQAKSGHAFAKAVKAQHDFSEHEMFLVNYQPRHQDAPGFEMHQATLDDKPAMIEIIQTDIPDENDARQLVEDFYATPNQSLYLSKLEGKPLGCLRLDYRDALVGIYGFVVRPEYRGRGYGRKMLEYVIEHINNEGPYTIMLEVETTNANAIGLYSSCGFQTRTTYDYLNRPI